MSRGQSASDFSRQSYGPTRRLGKEWWAGPENAERPTPINREQAPNAQCRSHLLRSDCGPLRSPEESKKEEVGVKKFTK